MTDQPQPTAEVALKPLYGHLNYLKDPDGLAMIRKMLLEVRDWHDPAPINCNSLARLLDTIEALRASPSDQPSGAVEADVYDLIRTFMFDRDSAIAGDPHSPDELDESVREIIRLAALSTPQPTGKTGQLEAGAQPSEGGVREWNGIGEPPTGLGRLKVRADDPLHESLRPSEKAVAAIERIEVAGGQAMHVSRGILVGEPATPTEDEAWLDGLREPIAKTFRKHGLEGFDDLEADILSLIASVRAKGG